MGNAINDSRKTKVSKILKAKPAFLNLTPAQIPVVIVSIIIGATIAIVFNLNYSQLVIHCTWPFGAWLIATNGKPGRFIAHFSGIPSFRRGRRKRKRSLGCSTKRRFY